MGEAMPLIDAGLVRRLLTAQFPDWADFPIRSIAPGGWDNRTFRLGEHMAVRLPSAVHYAAQVEKEHRWLPQMAPLLPVRIPTPLAIGQPAHGYPWKWSVFRWIEGDTATWAEIDDREDFATRLAKFLVALQRIDTVNGPIPGPDNFFRGGALRTYDAETKRAIALLKDKINAEAATELWNAALGTAWDRSPVWVHGDMSAGNLLMRDGRLCAVIDFGMLAVGDPACDLSIAWTLLSGDSRKTFQAILALDPGTWARGRAWTLWKALIVAAKFSGTTQVDAAQSWRVIDEVLDEASA